MFFKSVFLSAFVISFLSFCTKDVSLNDNEPVNPKIERMSGITMVAPPNPFEENPIPPISDVNAKWVCLVPYAFTPQNQPKVYYDDMGQWWGETPAGIRESVRVAHEDNIKVMLKPQVYIPGGWVGDMSYTTEADWLSWEKEYESYIMTMVDIAIETKIEMFCVGTEFKLSINERSTYWRDLITNIRAIYDGKILYSSNWDAYDEVEIWDAVDYIGISSYFPLSESITPTVEELSVAWKPIIKEMKTLSEKYDKKLLFTEYGYLSVDQCAHRSWELEKVVQSLPINEQAQANALTALYKNFLEEDFWMGCFLWKWFPNGEGAEGYIPRDYTPQDKIAEDVVRQWYAKF